MTTTTEEPKRVVRPRRGPHAPIALIGGGRLAHAIARLLARVEAPVVHWARDPDQRALLARSVAGMRTTTSIEEATGEAAIVIFAVPTDALTETARAFGDVALADQVVLHAARGAAEGFALPHQILRRETCVKKIGALGGPLFVDEAARGRPLVAVLASRFDEVTDVVRALVAGTMVRLHPTHDVVGVEVAAAMGLVSSLAAGVAEGLGLGETDQGVLLARGLLEAAALGQALGAEAATFTGLAGIGDLIPRAVSTTKRHREVGRRLARGARTEVALASVEGALEGAVTAREAQRLAAKLGLSLPLVDAVARVLDGNEAPDTALERVLQLDLDLNPAGAWAGRAS